MKKDFVILVDDNDCEIGMMEKLQAHQEGALHRAFSILIINSKGELLLQQRAIGKYHSEGLWTNACCSHPKPGESIEMAAERRLIEELGINTQLIPSFQFKYYVNLDNQLIEHEYDHVLFGTYSGKMNPNPTEVMNTKWLSLQQIQEQMITLPHHFTFWFKEIITKHSEKIHSFIAEKRNF